MTAWANDVSYEHVFSEQLKNFVQARDVVFAISASGNSPNVLRALKTARESRATTVGVSGYQGGKTALYALVASLRPKSARPLVRFEGLPGEFSQHDLGKSCHIT